MVFDIVVYKVMIALEVLVPVALYVSVALGLGRLYHDSEITAVAAAGMSPLRLYGAVAILALPIAVGVTALSLYGRPWAYANAYQLEQESKTELDIDHLLAERFNINAENGRMILAERVDRATDSLQDVLIFDGGESRTRLYRSQEARIADPDPDDPVVEMTNGTAYSLQHDGTQDKRIEFKRLNIHLQPLETNMESRRKAASWQTLEASAGLPEQAELQWRESRGVSTFILALLAIPLSRTAPRRGRFATLLPVTAVYAVIFYAGDICKSLVGNGSLPPDARTLAGAPGHGTGPAGPDRPRAGHRPGEEPMRILERYLLGNLLLGFAAAAALLLPLFSTLDLVGELDDIGDAGYRLGQALQVTLMTLPRRAVELGPFIALLGGIAALGQLSMSQELSVLRTAGVSATRIGLTALLAGTLLAGGLGALDEFVASPLQQKAIKLRAYAKPDNDKDDSIWARKDGQVVRIGSLATGRVPNHLEIFRFDESNRLQEYILADRAEIQPGGLWQLHDVRLKRWSDEGESVERLERLEWRAILPDSRLDEVTLPPASLSARQLRGYVHFLQNTGQPSIQFEIALWQKLGVPILTLAMILFALPFTFAPVRSTGLGSRLALGAVMGLLVYIGNESLVSLGQLLKLNAMLVGLLPALVLLGMALALVRRFDRGKP
ncbi:LPS export ABC transporter permease LptG [Azotobacter vinelandii]